jgi:precorrin-3B synthase
MSPPAPRNACPTIAEPMATGDGLLARLPSTDPLPIASMAAVVDAAGRHGNGLLEVSARGSLQVRGLSAATVTPFAAALAEAGLSDTRPAIQVPPLAGLVAGDSPDPARFRHELRAAVANAGLAPRLAPKLSVVVDGPGVLHLDALDADLRVSLADGRAGLALGGDAATARPVGSLPAARAVAAVLRTLALLAERGPTARGRDLDAAALAAALCATPEPRPPQRAPANFMGLHRLADGRVALGLGLPFGCAEAGQLGALLAAATAAGASHVAPAPDRTLIVIGLPAAAATAFADAAASLGFITEDADPRRSVAACAGAPACASGLMPARRIAGEVAAAAAPILDGSVTLHLSGCAKGCAHPAAAMLAFVGTEEGLAMAVDGRAETAIPTGLAAGETVTAVARLAHALSAERRSGETAAETVARLGPHRLAAALLAEPVHA